MAISVTVGGTDYTAGDGYEVDLESIKVTEDILNDQWEFDFDIVIADGAIAPPQPDTEVIFNNGSGREFAGVMAYAQEEQLDPVTFRYHCVANNYEPWFDRHLAVEDYPQQAASTTIASMVSAFCPGFTTNHVQTAPTVAEYKADYKVPTAVVKDLANLLAWQWYIDYDKDLHFFLSESIPSPLPLNTLNADTDLVDYGDLVLTRDGTQVKNRIFCKGFYVMSSVAVPVYILCDGQNDTYMLPQIPAGTSAKYWPSLTVGGVPYTPKPDVASGLPGTPGGASDTAYISVSNMTIRVEPKPAQGTVIAGSMYYKYQPIYVQDDPALIQEQVALEGGGSDGIYEYAVQDPRMSGDDTSLAALRAGYLLAKYGPPQLAGKIVSYTQGWMAGQSFYLNSARRWGGISNQLMYVARCEKTVVNHPAGGTPTLKYTLTIADRPFLWAQV